MPSQSAGLVVGLISCHCLEMAADFYYEKRNMVILIPWATIEGSLGSVAPRAAASYIS